jgi:hypothetical protein
MTTTTATIIDAFVTCRFCARSKPRSEYAVKDKRSGRLDRGCKACRKERHSQGLYEYTRVETDETKLCNGCAEIKPKTEFYARVDRLGKVTPRCKRCTTDATNERFKHLVRIDWTERLIKYARCNRLRRGAAHALCDFQKPYLFELYAEQEGRCYWTGVKLSLETMGKPWSVSLDRLDNSVGYVKGNVVLATRAANLARNSASPEDFKAFIQMIREV